MSITDPFRYDGKHVLVVGGATGMGAAGAELALALGARVTVMDHAEVALPGVKGVRLNLAEKASIDDALQHVSGPVDAVFACAGVADGAPAIERINYVGHRYLVERLVEDDKLTRGGAVCFIASTAGLGWEANYAALAELLALEDFDTAARWLVDNDRATYIGTKQAMCAYVAGQAYAFLKRGIRINGLCPGPTDTPLAQANRERWLGGGGAEFRRDAGIATSVPMDQAYPMAFLCSDAAGAIAGVNLVSDSGWFNAGHTGSYPAATPLTEMVLARPAAFRARQ